MTLHDLKGIINYTFDIADNEVDASFYIELDEINENYLGNIEVVSIDRDLITCKLTDFIRRYARFHPTKLTKYINEAYYEGEQKDYLINQIANRQRIANIKAGEDITDDGGEAVYHFITNDMYDFLTQKEI